MQLHGVAVVAGGAALAVAALEDLRRRILPNRYVFLAALCGIVAASGQPLPELLGALALAFGVFLLLWMLVIRDLLGGGDAKMLPAACLLVPLSHVPALLLAIGLWGGILALIFLLLRESLGGRAAFPLPFDEAPANPWRARDQVAAGVPYGLAIWLGLISTLTRLA